MKYIRVSCILMVFVPAAFLLLSIPLLSSCGKNISDDWRTEGLNDGVLRVVVRVPLCDRGSESRCRDELAGIIREAGRARSALLLTSYANTRMTGSEKKLQRQDSVIPPEGRIVRIQCADETCDALLEYPVQNPDGM